MERNTLELACNSLFIEKIKIAFKAAEVDRLVKIYSFSKQRTSGLGSVHLQVAEPLIDQEADANTVAGALLPPLLSQGRTQPNEIHRYFGQKIANTISELTSPFILRTVIKPHRRMDTHALLESMGGPTRKKVRLKMPLQGKFP
jgi:(p)ppGpp synthase/HD superfamily hydrolase